MNQKLSMKELLEKRKAHRASQDLTNAKIEEASEQEAANDPTVDAANEQSEHQHNVANGGAEIQRELPPVKKKHLTMKEMVNAKIADKQRWALALAKAAKVREHQDEPVDGNEEETEQPSPNDDDDDDPVEQDDDEVTEEITCRPAEKAQRSPVVTTAIAPGLNKPYPVSAFGSFAAVIMLIARAVQVDLEMVGSSLLGVVSALAQAIINVSSKASGTGCPVTVNMFVIAASGERKSTTIDAIAKPVYAALNRAEDDRRSMIIQDVTVDGMVVGLITRSPSQFLLALEGASLLGGHAMSKDNLSRFLGNVSSLFSGEALTRTRVEEHHYAQDRRLSVLLFSQPVVATDFLSSPLIMQQGLGNRFMYSLPRSLVGLRKHIDVELEDEPVYKQYCEKIAALASQEWKINPQTGGVDTRTVRMSPGAKAAWVDFYNSLELAAGPGGDLATHVGYVTRFPEQVMRLAALLAILEDPSVESISEEIMERAIVLGDYYLDSAMNAFNVTPANKDERDARDLLDWMQIKIAELNIAAIPVRMIYKNGPRCARHSKRAKELLQFLKDRGEVIEFNGTIIYDNNKRSAENYAVIGT